MSFNKTTLKNLYHYTKSPNDRTIISIMLNMLNKPNEVTNQNLLTLNELVNKNPELWKEFLDDMPLDYILRMDQLSRENELEKELIKLGFLDENAIIQMVKFLKNGVDQQNIRKTLLHLINENHNKQMKIDDITQDYNITNCIYESNDAYCSEMQTIIDNLKVDIVNYKAQIEFLNLENTCYKNDIFNLAKESRLLKDDNYKLQYYCDDLLRKDFDLDKKIDEITSLQNTVTELNKTLNRQKLNADKHNTKFQNLLVSKIKSDLVCGKKIKEYENKIESMTNDISKLNEDLYTNYTTMELYKKRFDENLYIAGLTKNENTKLEQHNEDLTQKLKSKEINLGDQLNTIMKLHNIIENLKTKEKNSEEELEKLNVSNEKLKCKNLVLYTQNDSLNKTNNDIIKKYENFNKTCVGCNIEHEENDFQVQMLKCHHIVCDICHVSNVECSLCKNVIN
jgi:hypothetical protein